MKDYSSIVKPIVDYLYENNQKFAAQAVQNALGHVASSEAGQQSHRSYSPSVNRYLCEALYFVNSDPNAEHNSKLIVRKLLEEYRRINGMPTDDVDNALGEQYVEVNEKTSVSVPHADTAAFILENTERGKEYDLCDIQEAVFNQFHFDDTEETMEELVMLGEFAKHDDYFERL